MEHVNRRLVILRPGNTLSFESSAVIHQILINSKLSYDVTQQNHSHHLSKDAILSATCAVDRV